MENDNKGNLGQENWDNDNLLKKANLEISPLNNPNKQQENQSNPQMEQDRDQNPEDNSKHDQQRNLSGEDRSEQFRSSTEVDLHWNKDLNNPDENQFESQTDQIFSKNPEELNNHPQSEYNAEDLRSENKSNLDSPQNSDSSHNNFKRADVNDEDDSEIENENNDPENFL